MSWRSDKGYSAAGTQQPLLDYFKMYYFKSASSIFIITNLMFVF